VRVCPKHFKPATESLKSLKTGEEFDLCPICEQELREIIHAPADKPAAEPEKRTVGTRRPAGRPKKAVA
jgi:hypothetical protein